MFPTSASFLVTENCNLACKYCFEHHNENVMSEEVAYAALDFLSNNAEKEKSREFHAMLFGGEPLLNIDLIDKIFHRGEKLAKEKGLRFTTSMVTNATIMNDEIKDVLDWHKDSSHLTVQLSIDGDQKSQDLYRVTKAGNGSFSLVEKNIETFKEIFKNRPMDLCVHSCINKQTLPNMFHNFIFFRTQWGFQNVWFLPVMEEKWDEDDIKLYDEQERLIYNAVKNYVLETQNINSINFYSPFDRCLNVGRPNKPCGAGDNFVTITANGDIFPCHQIYFNNKNRSEYLGNVLKGGCTELDARKKYLEYNSECLDCPKDCPANNCYRCIAVNFQYNGDILKQIHGTYCDLMKIDKKYQDELKSFLQKEHFVNIETDQQYDCLCNSRECKERTDGCDIVNHQSVCESGNNPDNPSCLCDIDNSQQYMQDNKNSEFEETASMAMQIMLHELQDIKKGVNDLNEHIRSKN